MNRKIVYDIGLILLLVVAVFMLVQVFFQMRTKGYQCLQDPLKYGAIRMIENNDNKSFTCSCYLEGLSSSLFLSKEGIKLDKQIKDNKGDLNFSGLFE